MENGASSAEYNLQICNTRKNVIEVHIWNFQHGNFLSIKHGIDCLVSFAGGDADWGGVKN